MQRAAPIPAVGEQRPTLVFGTDGRVSGNTGCNTYSGSYQEASDQLTIGPVVTTLRACLDEALARQEQVMTQVLNGPTAAMTRQGSRLTLSAPAGILVFLAATIQNQPSGEQTLPPTGGVPAVGMEVLLVLAALVMGLGVRLRLLPRRH